MEQKMRSVRSSIALLQTSYLAMKPTIGIRLALGASRPDVVIMVLRESLVPVAARIILGLLATLASTRLMANRLFGIAADDPLPIAMATILMTTVAVTAGFSPAQRASHVRIR